MLLKELRRLVMTLEKFLESDDMDEFGCLLHEYCELKNYFKNNIHVFFVNEVYKIAMK
jgi:hypothetical protein